MANDRESIDVETAEENAYIDVGDYMGVQDRQTGEVANVVEICSESRSVAQQPLDEMINSLFYSKLSLHERTFCTTQADAAINICLPDITDGYMFFDELHALAGPKLIRECQKYVGMQHGSCRVTRAFNATNFKCIIHTTLPADLSNQRIVDVELAQTAIRRCLNEAVSRGAKTIAFPAFFPAFTPIVSIEFVLKVISNWMWLTNETGQLDRLTNIQILCHQPSIYNIYRGMIRKLAIEFHDMATNSDDDYFRLFNVHAVVLQTLKRRRPRGGSSACDVYINHYDEVEYDPNARRRPRRLRTYPDEYVQPQEPPQVKLELSAKLQPSVLVLDDRSGMKRQYRLTNKSKDGRKLYFRCSYCDTLIRKTNIQIRAKITLQDGRIVGDSYPEHHPDCKPKNEQELMVQQLDRKSRRDVKEGRLAPRDAYEQARQLAMKYQQQRLEESGELKAKEEEIDEDVMRNVDFDDENLEMDSHTDIEQSMETVRVSSRKRRHGSSPPKSHVPQVPNFPAWPQIRQQYFRMRKVGAQQKEKQEQQRADNMREATFVVREEDEEQLIEVEGIEGGLDPVDVLTVVEPRKPRILQHANTRPAAGHLGVMDSVIKVDVD